MIMIRVWELAKTGQGFKVKLSFSEGRDYILALQDPSTSEEERLWEWYFDEYLQFPLIDQTWARQAAEGVRAYGERLFEQVFHQDLEAYAEYVGIRDQLDQVRIEIVGDSPEFQAWHWEAMWDPGWPRPLGVDCGIVRQRVRPSLATPRVAESPMLNLLIVTARPDADRDVAYRTISRPLVEAIDAAQLPVTVDLLRPGTYEALAKHLDQHRNYYHIIHFDAHGSLATFEQLRSVSGSTDQAWGAPLVFMPRRYGRPDIQPYDGVKGFLWMENEQGGEDPVEVAELGDLLLGAGIPIGVFNTCQSGKLVPQRDHRETSLASGLMMSGMQMVVAMSYSLTVSAAQILMEMFYRQIFEGVDLSQALRIGRQELFNHKERRAYFGMTIQLEDWVVPVAYGESRLDLKLREFTYKEKEEFWLRQERRYRFLQPTYGFVGRDVDILKIERRLIRHNMLLVRGMGGTGKTTLLRYLQEWWDRTRFAEQIFYFGYDERVWTVDQIVGEIGGVIFGTSDPFFAMEIEARRGKIGQYLRSEPVVLILDGLEFVTEESLAIPNTLNGEERDRLREFLEGLMGGKCWVVLGSRGGEEWLQDRTFGDNVHQLQGLDGQARTELAEKILQRHVRADRIGRIKTGDAFKRLMKLLAGYPLPMEVVLANLRDQEPEQILEALDRADVELDRESEDKTISILKCVEYSHSHLSKGTQDLLVCLAPFNGLVDRSHLENYGKQLKRLDPFREHDFDRFNEAIQDGIDWGLLSPMDAEARILTIQPIFPYFLRVKLKEVDLEAQEALWKGFRDHYIGLARSYLKLLESNDSQRRQLGTIFCRLEYENLFEALRICLEKQETIEIFLCLNKYLMLGHDPQAALELSIYVCGAHESYPLEKRQGEIGYEMIMSRNLLATGYLQIQNYQEAKRAYHQTLELLEKVNGVDPDRRSRARASIYHQLGNVALYLRETQEARYHYQTALKISVESGDRYSQASTYHQLGILAQRQRDYEEARRCYLQTLEICAAFNDRYSQAGAYHQLGRVAEERREYEEARRCYLQALEIKVEFNDRHSQASTYHQLGRVAEEQKEYEEARRCYLQALKIYVEFNDRYSQASVYHQLGNVAQAQEEQEEAYSCYQQALEIKVQSDDRYSQASTYHQLGIVAQELGDSESSLRYFQEASEIYQAFNDRYALDKTSRQLNRTQSGL